MPGRPYLWVALAWVEALAEGRPVQVVGNSMGCHVDAGPVLEAADSAMAPPIPRLCHGASGPGLSARGHKYEYGWQSLLCQHNRGSRMRWRSARQENVVPIHWQPLHKP